MIWHSQHTATDSVLRQNNKQSKIPKGEKNQCEI